MDTVTGGRAVDRVLAPDRAWVRGLRAAVGVFVFAAVVNDTWLSATGRSEGIVYAVLVAPPGEVWSWHITWTNLALQSGRPALRPGRLGVGDDDDAWHLASPARLDGVPADRKSVV